MSATASIPALIAWTVVFTVGAYFVCGIPFGLVIAKTMGHIDVREVGSGNIGTTNVARSVGKGAAAFTLLCDLGKGCLWMLLSRFLISLIVFGEVGFSKYLDHTVIYGVCMSVVYAGCVLGHVFSPYLNFHGGKGIAVGFGAALGLWWPMALTLLLVFFVFAIPSRYVSLGSICTAASLPIQAIFYGFPLESIIPLVVVAVVVVWSHRSNIKKLLAGEERKFAFHKPEKAEEAAEEASTDVEEAVDDVAAEIQESDAAEAEADVIEAVEEEASTEDEPADDEPADDYSTDDEAASEDVCEDADAETSDAEEEANEEVAGAADEADADEPETDEVASGEADDSDEVEFAEDEEIETPSVLEKDVPEDSFDEPLTGKHFADQRDVEETSTESEAPEIETEIEAELDSREDGEQA